MIRRIFFLLAAGILLLFSPAKNHAAENSAVDYEMPYPGLLPTHPLYPLKIGRDGIISFFISNPLKKAEFNLLQADKRIGGSFLLLVKDKNKSLLAEQTFSKGENYYEQGIGYLDQARKQGIETTDLVRRYALANKKHQEVMRNLLKEASSREKAIFIAEQRRLTEFEKSVKRLSQ